MKKIFFLVNSLKEFIFVDFLEKYLSEMIVCVGEQLPENTEEFDLIILWSYKKIITGLGNKDNVILFHSSDLPEGKGWAPIYNAIINNKEFYTISCIFAEDAVDSGNIIAKAKFKIKDNYTAEFIRQCDTEISIMLIRDILTRFDNKKIVSKKQEGDGSFYLKRKPEDNEISLKSKFNDIINHLRACEKKHPAYFWYNQNKYFIYIEPELKPEFPKDLEIIFWDEI